MAITYQTAKFKSANTLICNVDLSQPPDLISTSCTILQIPYRPENKPLPLSVVDIIQTGEAQGAYFQYQHNALNISPLSGLCTSLCIY